jgi:UDP-N-acetylglucosamine 2-epimerase
MSDSIQYAALRTERSSHIVERMKLHPREYLLVTVHRAENTEDPVTLRRILQTLTSIQEQIVFPVHPRTQKKINETAVELGYRSLGSNVSMIEPVGYFDMVALTKSARLVLTDSGGLQKEAYWLGVPCLTMREETEWTETLEHGWNTLVGTDPSRITELVGTVKIPKDRPVLYGDGNVSPQCVEILSTYYHKRSVVRSSATGR